MLTAPRRDRAEVSPPVHPAPACRVDIDPMAAATPGGTGVTAPIGGSGDQPQVLQQVAWIWTLSRTGPYAVAVVLAKVRVAEGFVARKVKCSVL